MNGYHNNNASSSHAATIKVYQCTENSDGTLTPSTTAIKSDSYYTRNSNFSLSVSGLDENIIYMVEAATYRSYLYEIAFQTQLKKDPTLSATPEALTFNCEATETDEQTFTVTGTGLSGNVTLTLNDENGVFSLSTESITPSNKTVNKTVAVTFAPQNEGEYTGSVTIANADGLEPITIPLNATATKHTSDNETLLYESFSGYTSTSDGTQAIATTDNRLDYKSWTSFTNVFFGKDGCGKLGTRSALGSMTASDIALKGKGQLTFKVKNYGSDTGMLNIVVTGATATGDLKVTPQADWTEYTVDLTDATGSVSLTLETSAKRAYIDEIKLVSIVPTTIIGDVNRDGKVDIIDVTAMVSIILGNDSTEPYTYDHLAADVNGDGDINITDVTLLVNLILTSTNN